MLATENEGSSDFYMFYFSFSSALYMQIPNDSRCPKSVLLINDYVEYEGI